MHIINVHCISNVTFMRTPMGKLYFWLCQGACLSEMDMKWILELFNHHVNKNKSNFHNRDYFSNRLIPAVRK